MQPDFRTTELELNLCAKHCPLIGKAKYLESLSRELEDKTKKLCVDFFGKNEKHIFEGAIET